MKGQGTGKNGRQAVAPARGRSSSAAPKGARPGSRGAKTPAQKSAPTKDGAKTIARVASQRSASQRGRSGIKEGAKLPTKKELDNRGQGHSRATQQKLKQQQQKNAASELQDDEDEASGGEGHIWLSLLVFFIAGYLFLCTISFLMYWQQDASAISMGVGDSSSLSEVQNWGGRLGARVADLLIGNWLGLSGVLVPLYLFMLGLRILRIETLRFKRSMPSLLAIIFVLSLALGHVYGASTGVFGSGWGGAGGIYVSEWLEAMIGPEGTSLLIIFLTLGVVYYSFAGWVKRVARHVTWYFERRAQKRREALQWARAKRAQAAMELPALSEELQQRGAEDQGVQEDGSADETVSKESAVQDEAMDAKSEQQSAMEQESATPESEENKDENPTSESQQEETVEEIEEQRQSSTSIVPLEGGVVGYIYGYDQAGDALYLYADAQFLKDNVTEVPVEAAKVQEEEPEEDFVIVERHPEPAPPVVETVEVPLVVEPPKEEMVEIITQSTQPTPAPKTEEAIGFEVQKSNEDEKLAERKIDNMELYDPTAELPKYRKPLVDLLHDHTKKVEVSAEELQANKDRIIHTLLTFGIKIDRRLKTWRMTLPSLWQHSEFVLLHPSQARGQ